MKRLVIFFLCFVVLFGLTGCGESKIKLIDDVQLILKEGTLTNTGATFILENKRSDSIHYGEPYHLEEERDGKWYLLETVNDLFFNLPLYYLESEYTDEFEIDWEYGYGKLSSGKYRLVKKVNEEYVVCEFVIE